MAISRRALMTAATLSATASLAVGTARAADPAYPSRTVRILVAYAPGGAVDTTLDVPRWPTRRPAWTASGKASGPWKRQPVSIA